jgi:hypothetical protein
VATAAIPATWEDCRLGEAGPSLIPHHSRCPRHERHLLDELIMAWNTTTRISTGLPRS